jgi:flagellar motor protein MotB
MSISPTTSRRGLAHWLTTYGDLMSLLLVLFVYLFSISAALPPQALTLEPGPSRYGLPLLAEVKFETSGAEVTPEEKARLGELAERLDLDRPALLVLGFASAARPRAEAQGLAPLEELARRRAREVASCLEQLLALRAPRIVLGGRGARERPVLPGDRTGDRVDVCLLPPGLMEEEPLRDRELAGF